MNDTQNAPPAPEWAMVEIMGHRTHAGEIREVERFGAKMLEVREFGTGDATPWRVHYYGGGSIFSITPCTEEYARKSRDQAWRYSRGGDPAPLLAWEQPEDGEDTFADDEAEL